MSWKDMVLALYGLGNPLDCVGLVWFWESPGKVPGTVPKVIGVYGYE